MGSIPKDPNFLPLSSDEDLSSSTLLSLSILEDSMGVDMQFAGACRVSVGFMQTIIELLTKPRDIVLDWVVGEGWTFYARDYSGRHVIWILDRVKFGDVATQSLTIVHERNLVEAVVDPVVDEEPIREVEEQNKQATPADDVYAILGDVDAHTPSPPRLPFQEARKQLQGLVILRILWACSRIQDEDG